MSDVCVDSVKVLHLFIFSSNKHNPVAVGRVYKESTGTTSLRCVLNLRESGAQRHWQRRSYTMVFLVARRPCGLTMYFLGAKSKNKRNSQNARDLFVARPFTLPKE